MKELSPRRAGKRPLSLQPLETRRLLAADGCDCEDMVSEPAAASQSLAASDASASEVSASTVTASDAGSTRRTAFDLGSIDGNRTISGSLGRRDVVDTFRFTVDRDADVRIDLYGLNRNANLYVFDESGLLVGRSTRAGGSSDSVFGSLDAGDYYVSVVAGSFRSIRYRLSISAELQPELPPPPQIADPPREDRPEGELPETTIPGRTVQPLREVAYFGGSREWNLNAIGAPEAWAAGFSGQGVTVAVVDTGVDLDHPDLVQNLFVNPGEIPGNGIDDDANGFVDDVNGYDFADRDADPNDVGGHGTHVAGTIAAGNNGFGATGVAPNATILPVRVLGDNGSGSTSDVAAGIRYAARLGADIINLSLGGGYSRTIDAAIDYARSLGSFIVAAAGNESAAVPSFPARFSATDENVISVGAYRWSGTIAGFSNDVGSSGAVQVDAPGVGIYSTYVGGRYATLSGTSMASPHVAGLAALTLSSNPNLTSRELRDLLATGTVGRINGSDAIGTVNATTTVAYAAAGLTAAGGSSNSVGGVVSSTAGTARGGNLRITEAIDLVIGGTEPIGRTDIDNSFVAETYDVISGKINLVSADGSSPATSRETRVDHFFATDRSTSAHDDNDQDDVDTNLKLLA